MHGAVISTGRSWTAAGRANSVAWPESHPRVRAYVKNHNLGFGVPYRLGSQAKRYIPDYIVLVDYGNGDEDFLHLVVEIKGYRGEDAKEKKSTMETYWVPGINKPRRLRAVGVRRVHGRRSH